MDYEELRKMTVIKLREEAQKFPDVKGTSGMKKEQLIDLLCEKLGIEMHKKPKKLPVNKGDIKKNIRDLKTKRQEAIERKDYTEAALCRKRIHVQKRRLRKAIKEALKAAT
jgi:protein-arginine kinase activator protein McsA